jgi:predicted metal-dependent hydrolase
VIDRPAARGVRDSGAAAAARPGTVIQGGRAKAYRPLPAETRRQAYDQALESYDRGDFFLTHELLEPAWMGTDDPAERALHQGLIKLAAAFVHGVRGNPKGIARNLVGARERLADAVGTAAAADSGLDLVALLAAIDERLTRLAADPTDASIDAPDLPRSGR